MESVVSAKERLQKLQAALEKRGVQDVKFCLSLGSETSVEDLASEVADVLEAVEKGAARKISTFAELNLKN